MTHLIGVEDGFGPIDAGAGAIPQLGVLVLGPHKQVEVVLTLTPRLLLCPKQAKISFKRLRKEQLRRKPITATDSASRKPVR